MKRLICEAMLPFYWWKDIEGLPPWQRFVYTTLDLFVIALVAQLLAYFLR